MKRKVRASAAIGVATGTRIVLLCSLLCLSLGLFVSLPVHFMHADGVRDNISQAPNKSCLLRATAREVSWSIEHQG